MLAFFRFTVPFIAVDLQNANANFHKVVYRHYSGEVENVYITVWRICSDNTRQILSESVGFSRSAFLILCR